MSILFENITHLTLASNSPRRRRYLKDAGIHYSAVSAEINEDIDKFETPDSYVKRMAREKAEAVLENHRSGWILSADTIVVAEGKILGKPRNENHAKEMLKALSGKYHGVKTAFCLKNKTQCILKLVETQVEFASLETDIIEAYVTSGEPMDKAGAYGIQGMAGMFVKGVYGSYSNVVGLPMQEVLEEMLKQKIIKISK